MPAAPSTLLPGTLCQETDFTYKDGIFCATYDGHVHPRKEASELHTHLTYVAPPPAINENGKRTWNLDAGTPTNYPAHFYAAQLMHYGLKPLKTKPAAKKKLLSAFGGHEGKTLLVPKSILDLEKAMRKGDQKTTTAKPAPRTKLTAKKTTRPIVLTTTSMEVDQKPQPAIFVSEQPKPVNATHASTSTRSPRTKQTARKSTGGLPPPSPPPPVDARSAVKNLQKLTALPKMTRAELRDEIKRLPVARARQILDVLLEKVPAVATVLEKELSSTRVSSKAKEKAINPSEWTGLYDINAPALAAEDLYGSGGYTFEIYPSSTSAHLWAYFYFGHHISGVMRSIHPAPNFLNTEVFFEWHGFESEEHIMSFDSDNRAVITFLPGGLLEGKMCASFYGTFKLYGCRPVNPVTSTAKHQRKEVSSWKKTWRSINDHNYEVARVARWGKWGGEEKDDEAFASDTTAGKMKHSSKIDLQKFMKEPSSDNEDDEDEDEEDDEDEDDGGYGWW